MVFEIHYKQYVLNRCLNIYKTGILNFNTKYTFPRRLRYLNMKFQGGCSKPIEFLIKGCRICI